MKPNGRVNSVARSKSAARCGIAVLATIVAGANLGTTLAPAPLQGAGDVASTPQAIQEKGAEQTLDERLAEIARHVPPFGGVFLDDRGQVTMYVLAVGSGMEQAPNQVAAALGIDARIAHAGPIRVVAGQFTFLELKQWRDDVNAEVLALPGVVSTDIDEARNRLRVGIERADVAGAVEDRLDWFGVPREAVQIEVTGPIRQLNHDLRDQFRPLVGGVQINFPGSGGSFLCTLGFPALRRNRMGFVTNSHCTAKQGGTEATIYHQPEESGTANRIGREFRDPRYRKKNCPTGRRCRYSDTAFVTVPHGSGPAVTIDRGIIARPKNKDGSLEIRHSRDEYRIVGEASDTLGPLAGELLNKAGRTTGRSEGQLVYTCADTNVFGTNKTLLCQNQVSAAVGPGDSGSPVFKITDSPKRDDVSLAGILWGGGSYGQLFVYSPIDNVQRGNEMGNLTVCHPDFPC